MASSTAAGGTRLTGQGSMVEQEGSGFIQRRGSMLFLGSRRGRKRQEVGTELKEVKVGYGI
jgi:hypothetical protein